MKRKRGSKQKDRKVQHANPNPGTPAGPRHYVAWAHEHSGPQGTFHIQGADPVGPEGGGLSHPYSQLTEPADRRSVKIIEELKTLPSNLASMTFMEQCKQVECVYFKVGTDCSSRQTLLWTIKQIAIHSQELISKNGLGKGN